jgi:hypothetical protein
MTPTPVTHRSQSKATPSRASTEEEPPENSPQQHQNFSIMILEKKNFSRGNCQHNFSVANFEINEEAVLFKFCFRVI